MCQNTRDSFKDACKRWDCDYLEYTEKTPYHPALMKLKAFELYPDYERLFIIDSDCIIRSDTPSPFNFDKDIFGAVQNQQARHPGAYKTANVQGAKQGIELVKKYKNLVSDIDIEWLSNYFFNSGVLLVNRDRHESVLDFAFGLCDNVPGLMWWDQIPLNVSMYLLLGNYTNLGEEWNYQFPYYLDRMAAYVYHFAGLPTRYEDLKHVNWKA